MESRLQDETYGSNGTPTRREIRLLAVTAVNVALLATAGQLSIPLPGGVPLTLQTLFLLLMGLVLPPRHALLGAASYLLLGALGFPVFSGGRGGVGVFAGPTGGYLAGFLLAPPLVALVKDCPLPPSPRALSACIAGLIPIYACGLVWLRTWHGLSWNDALHVGLLPFLALDAMKAAGAAALHHSLSCTGLLPLGQKDEGR